MSPWELCTAWLVHLTIQSPPRQNLKGLKTAANTHIVRPPENMSSLLLRLYYNAFILSALDVIQRPLEVLLRSLQTRTFLVRLQIRMYELDEAVQVFRRHLNRCQYVLMMPSRSWS